MRLYSKSVLWGITLATLSIPTQPTAHADCQSNEVRELKQGIWACAYAWQGQGDPDGSKQSELELAVYRLLDRCPQPDVKDRLPLITGAWQQIWGPYTYRDDSRGVDPTLDPKHIYQVVFPGHYYYNVSPSRDKQGQSKHRTGLLRGEYKLDPKHRNALKIHFTHLRGVKGTPPEGFTYTQLPALSEQKKLNQFTLLPSLFVRLFFGGGMLTEVYTDDDMRITFGSSNREFKKSYIYILKRVPQEKPIN
jgi:hypothetical protein